MYCKSSGVIIENTFTNTTYLVKDCITDMEYLITYLKTLEQTGEYSDNTIHAYSSDLNRFFVYLEKSAGRLPDVTEISALVIKEFLEKEKKIGFAASTLHRRKVVLSQFLNYLSKTGQISKRELHEVGRWKEKNLWKEIYNRDIQYLSETEISTLFCTLEDENSAKALRDRSIISLMLETGLPIGKVIGLDIDDIDLSAETLTVSYDWHAANLSIKECKIFLKAYLDNGRKQFTQSEDEQALFISQMGGRISRQGVWQIVKEWGIKANLPTQLSPRILRNTKIRQMVQSGLPTSEIQRCLGHRNRYSTRALIRKVNRIR